MGNFSFERHRRVKHEIYENVRIGHAVLIYRKIQLDLDNSNSVNSNSRYFKLKTITLRFTLQSSIIGDFYFSFPLRVRKSGIQLHPKDKQTRSRRILNSNEHSQSLYRSYPRPVSQVILTVCWYSFTSTFLTIDRHC